MGIPDTTGASFTAVTVNAAASESDSRPGSVAVNVIVSLPFQVGDGMAIVATRPASIVTVSSVLPEYVQLRSASRSSTSLT